MQGRLNRWLQRAMFWAGVVAILGPSPASGQQIYIDNVAGIHSPGRIKPGQVLSVRVNVFNDTTINLAAISYGFKIQSTGGATWDTVQVSGGDVLNTGTYFDYQRVSRLLITPPAPDTVYLSLWRIFQPGLQPGFDGELLTIDIGPIHGPDGAGIRVDSITTAYLDGNTPPSVVFFPTGDSSRVDFEALSVTVADCCEGSTGDVDGDGAISLSDLTQLVQKLFVAPGPVPCIETADVYPSPPGTVNLTDLQRLLNHLFVTFEPLPACP